MASDVRKEAGIKRLSWFVASGASNGIARLMLGDVIKTKASDEIFFCLGQFW